jgi:hypothetical protein
LELRLTEATGAIDVLRSERTAGSTDMNISAVRDRQNEKLGALEIKFAEAKGTLNALRAGRVLQVRGTYDPGKTYHQFDVVIINGSSFVALRDDAGDCPGEH